MLNLLQHPFIVSLQGRELCPTLPFFFFFVWPLLLWCPEASRGVGDTGLAKGEKPITELLSEH